MSRSALCRVLLLAAVLVLLAAFFAVFVKFYQTLFPPPFHRFFFPFPQRPLLHLFYHLCCTFYQRFPDGYKGVSDHTPPFVFVAIAASTFVTELCLLAWMIYRRVYQEKNSSSSIIMLSAKPIAFKPKRLFRPSVIQTLIVAILDLFTVGHFS